MANDPLKVFSEQESADGQLQAAIALIKEKQLCCRSLKTDQHGSMKIDQG